MTSTSLAQVLLRILGIYLIVISLASIGNVLMFLGQTQFGAAFLGSSISLIVTFVAGIGLVRDGDRIGSWLTSDLEPAGDATERVDPLPVALAILGVWFLVFGLSSAAIAGVAVVAGSRGYARELVSAVVDTVAGIVLIAGRGGVANAWARLRGRD